MLPAETDPVASGLPISVALLGINLRPSDRLEAVISGFGDHLSYYPSTVDSSAF